MINAERRGILGGYTEAVRLAALLEYVSDTLLDAIARLRWLELHSLGYAHIEPVEEFVAGFIQGFRQYFILQGEVYHVHHER